MQVRTPVDRIGIIEDIFGAHGKVVHTIFHYWKGSEEALAPSFDFILEVPETAPKDFMIPRGGHTKQQCPKLIDYRIDYPPVDVPTMARAFPDPEASFRTSAKIQTPANTGNPSNRSNPSNPSKFTESTKAAAAS
ncbi:hypothetical protein BGZ65_002353 [Modicella reniformis]|uniref:Uncharacterized protein n=1 Tax=Modicella reniformis TaxID=1440133 RepID=A0A9P6J6D1_9FUNG|nr:hypothetical protein BGZ65_002353 [Modicella reniformis]